MVDIVRGDRCGYGSFVEPKLALEKPTLRASMLQDPKGNVRLKLIIYKIGTIMKANKWNGESFIVKLRAGNKAKHFSLTDVYGNVINTKEYKNKKILLSFYRYQSCPLCNLRINKMIQKYPLYKENNLELISFFQSPNESMLEFMDRQDCPFPIIADPDKKMYKQYGVESSFLKLLKGLASKSTKEAIQKGFYPGKAEGDMKTVPADFLIDENFTIRKAFYGSHIGDHIPFEDIEEFISGTSSHDRY